MPEKTFEQTKSDEEMAMKDTYGCPDKLKCTGYLLMLYNRHKTDA